MAESDKEADRKWALEQIKKYTDILPRYERYAQVLKKVLEKAAKKYAPLAIVQTRPKSVASFGEKSHRKKAKYRDSLNRMTDLCGGRVITHTRTEVEAICKFIEGHFDIDWDNTIDLSQQLKPTEFGYRSIHYIVKFKPGVFPTKEIDVEIPEEVFDLKAEIQVRTVLEHVWADIAHSMSYKGAFKIPDKWERELAGLAAILEGADSSFARIQAGLQRYAASYGAYMTEEQMRDEIDNLEVILEHDPGNVELATRIGKLAVTLGDWQKAIDVLSKYVNSEYQPALRELGIAMCKLHRANPDSPEYQQGQKYLESASVPPHRDSDAIASLAGTWKGIDEDKARELYRQAFEVDPSDPYLLGNYLTYEIAHRRDTSLALLMHPVIDAAIQRCRDQASVGMNLPWAFYDMGKFYLLLRKPYESLAAYAKAVQLTTADWMIDTSLRYLEKLDVVRDALPGYEWVQRLLLVGRAAKFPTNEAIERVKKLVPSSDKPIPGPVVIVAGGWDVSGEQQIQDYRQLMLEAFRDFKGTIISGGTATGISGLVGDVGQKYCDAIRTIGYVPKKTPAVIDKRYSEIRYTENGDFSALEPLQTWVALIASGINPPQVKLLGINGGTITAAEYRIALALGAYVAAIEGSGREAAKLLQDDDWSTSKMLVHLPADAMTIRAFIGSGTPKLAPDLRETIAQAIHEDYRRIRVSTAWSQEPSTAEWDKLLDYLKESNRDQADHIVGKLRQIGCTVHKVTERDIAPMTFTEDEVEVMAEMEHARWNVERLLNGWKWGEKRETTKKTSPYLVPWSELSNDVKEWDRQTVRKMPEFLAKVGLEVRR